MKTTFDPALYPKFRNKSGTLTVYAFACGYIESAANGFQLFKDGCWHVRRTRKEWESFDTLKEAREHFREVSKLKPFTLTWRFAGNRSYENLNVEAASLHAAIKAAEAAADFTITGSSLERNGRLRYSVFGRAGGGIIAGNRIISAPLIEGYIAATVQP